MSVYNRTWGKQRQRVLRSLNFLGLDRTTNLELSFNEYKVKPLKEYPNNIYLMSCQKRNSDSKNNY